MKSILINGYFLCRKSTGIERYAFEITKRLDKICKPGEISIIIPNGNVLFPDYKNIKIIRHGKIIQNILWQMFTLQWYLITHRQYTVLEFGNTALPFAPGIVFLHDIYCELFPNDFSNFIDKIVRIYNRFQYRLISKKAIKIFTVSEHSKKEIINNFNVKNKNIDIIYSSADHMSEIIPDNSIFDDFPLLKDKSFFYSLGSLSKRKNIKWIIEYAKKNKDSLFAISGVSLPTVKIDELIQSVSENVIFLGYLEDGKIKALMNNCKAFLHSSYYEGFGLTPLEALSCGAQIIISNAACLPEIYGNTAHYINPFNTNVNLEELLSFPVDKPDDILDKYSYDKSTSKLYLQLISILSIK